MQTAHQINAPYFPDCQMQLVGPERIGPASEVHQCSWCNRFYLPSGQFVAAPFIAVNVSHGACPECFPKRLEAARRDRERV